MGIIFAVHVGQYSSPCGCSIMMGWGWDQCGIPQLCCLRTPAISGSWYTYPSEKYESQLGLLFPKYGKIKFMFQTTNQLYIHHIGPSLVVNGCPSLSHLGDLYLLQDLPERCDPGFFFVRYIYWLVVYLPLWKILANGKDYPIYYGK